MTLPKIDPYQVLEEIGRGGMGRVYRAHDPRLTRDVAIKVLLTRGQDPSNLARFLREAETLARIRSPYVVTVHDMGN